MAVRYTDAVGHGTAAGATTADQATATATRHYGERPQLGIVASTFVWPQAAAAAEATDRCSIAGRRTAAERSRQQRFRGRTDAAGDDGVPSSAERTANTSVDVRAGRGRGTNKRDAIAAHRRPQRNE